MKQYLLDRSVQCAYHDMNNHLHFIGQPRYARRRLVKAAFYCGTDVAAALGYSNSRDAIIRHCRYVVKRDAPHPQSPDRKISMTFIPEGDLYRLISRQAPSGAY